MNPLHEKVIMTIVLETYTDILKDTVSSLFIFSTMNMNSKIDLYEIHESLLPKVYHVSPTYPGIFIFFQSNSDLVMS